MMKNEMKTNNKTVLLAILAVFAMVFAGVAVAMSAGETEAAPTGDMPKQTDTAVANYYEVVITDHAAAQAIAAANEIVYLDMSAETADVTLTLSGAFNATVYVKPATASGVKLVLAGVATQVYTVAIAKSIATDTHTVTYYCNSVLTVTKGAVTSNDTITLAYSDAAGPTITCKASATDSSTIAAATYGVTFSDVSEKSLAIYAQGTTTPAIALNGAGDVVSVKNGSATVTSWGSSDAGYSVVSFAKVVSADAYTLTCGADKDAKTVIGGGAAAATGAITISGGAVTATALYGGLTGKLVWNTFSTAAMSDDPLATATLSAQGAAASVHVYGTISGTVETDAAINFHAATGTYTVGTDAAMLSIDAADLVVTNEAISAWTAGDITLTSKKFTTEMTGLSGSLIVGTSAELETALTTVAAGKNITVRGTMALTAGAVAVTDANVNVYGTMSSAGTTFTIKATDGKTATFKANAGSTLTKITVNKSTEADCKGTVTIDLSGATGTVYLKGTISSDATYSQTQAVVVEGDLEITSGALITIAGSFDVLEGVEVTITNGTIEISSDVADVEILGDVLIEENGFLKIVKTKEVKISSTVDNFGKFLCKSPKASLTSGAVFCNEDGAYFRSTNLNVDAGAVATLSGYTDVTDIKNKGTVILDGAELATLTDGMVAGGAVAATITMAADGAVVDVKSFAFVQTADTTTSKLTIDDSGITSTKYTSGYKNTVELTAKETDHDYNVGLGLSGIRFESSTSTSRAAAGDAKYLDRTLSMSGVATIVDINNPAIAEGKLAATITLLDSGVNGADFELAEGVALTKGITLNVNDNMTISGLVVLTDAAIDATAGDLVITGMVASNKKSVTGGVGDVNLSAVYFTVTVLTETTHYYSDLAGALKTIEEIEENVTFTVSGTKNVVAEDVTIPENVRIAGTGTITISPSTVTVYVEDGATAVAGVTFNVKGTLAVENVKKFTPTVISDVTVTVGNAAEYTSLNRALAEAEAGDIITVTKTDGIVIESNLTIPAGVVLVIPDDIDASVNVAKKVTITVDGVLMCNGIDGAFGTEVSATAAVMKVNGLAMIGAASAAAIGGIADNYKVSGAYWYLSDATGDFVYIGSLEDAADSKQAVKVYGKVNETESVIATKDIELVRFTDAAVAEALPTVLTVSDLSLYNTAADVKLDATHGVLKGQVTIPNSEADAIVSVNDFVGVLTYDYDAKGTASVVSDYDGALTVKSGIIYTIANIAPAATDSFTVQAGAEFVVTGAGVMNFGANVPAIVAGTLTAENGGRITVNSAKFVLTGLLYAEYDADTKAKGTLTIADMTFTSGTIMAADGAQIDVTDTLFVGAMPGTTGAAPAIDGKVVLTAPAVIIAYPGADVSDMVIGEEGDMVSTALTLDGKALATVYSDKNDGVMLMDVIAQIPIENIVGIDHDDAIAAKADPARWGITAATAVGDVAQAGTVVKADKANVKISVSTGMSIWIDGVRYNTGDMPAFTVGSHTVAVTVNPGYKYADGTTPTITFNGKALSGLLVFEITASMTAMDYVVLSAVGDIVVDQPDIPEQEKEDNSMIMILLGVLVIMVVILAIVTVIRMMRS